MTALTPPANRPSTIPPQRQYSTIAVVNGKRYRFTVSVDDVDVTNQYDWQKVAKEATKIALAFTGKKRIKEANIALDCPAGLNSAAPNTRRIELISATVRSKANLEAEEFTGDDIDAELQPKIRQRLRNIERNFRHLEATPTAHQQPPHHHLANNPLRSHTLDDYLDELNDLQPPTPPHPVNNPLHLGQFNPPAPLPPHPMNNPLHLGQFNPPAPLPPHPVNNPLHLGQFNPPAPLPPHPVNNPLHLGQFNPPAPLPPHPMNNPLHLGQFNPPAPLPPHPVNNPLYRPTLDDYLNELNNL